ncbi:DUF1566 domain-containing protein [Nitrosomonas sp. ANs5]|uniref:Lcl C-terminal domain-containing protein n=1 Tax=Nitrosomonas sp. ANs5 TaxID=3423941 RepID=UPI003D32BFAE
MKIEYSLYFALIALCALFTFAKPLYAQTCRNDITPTTPTQDFTLHDDSTVTHNKTGLMWMRCALGQSWNGVGCTGNSQSHNWQGALQVADGFSFAGHDDWRLPNIKELGSIVEQACISPAINTTAFPATPSTNFWSASTDAKSVNFAWLVAFSTGNGSVTLKSHVYSVRLVRGGE